MTKPKPYPRFAERAAWPILYLLHDHGAAYEKGVRGHLVSVLNTTNGGRVWSLMSAAIAELKAAGAIVSCSVGIDITDLGVTHVQARRVHEDARTQWLKEVMGQRQGVTTTTTRGIPST